MATTTLKFKIPFVSFEMIKGEENTQCAKMLDNYKLDAYTPIDRTLFRMESLDNNMGLVGTSSHLDAFAF